MSWFDFAGALRPFSLVFMTALFIYLGWRAFAPGRRQAIDEASRIPLTDDR